MRIWARLDISVWPIAYHLMNLGRSLQKSIKLFETWLANSLLHLGFYPKLIPMGRWVITYVR